jgi:hypothetical protein
MKKSLRKLFRTLEASEMMALILIDLIASLPGKLKEEKKNYCDFNLSIYMKMNLKYKVFIV